MLSTFEPAQIPALVLFILVVALVTEHGPLRPVGKCSPEVFHTGDEISPHDLVNTLNHIKTTTVRSWTISEEKYYYF